MYPTYTYNGFCRTGSGRRLPKAPVSAESSPLCALRRDRSERFYADPPTCISSAYFPESQANNARELVEFVDVHRKSQMAQPSEIVKRFLNEQGMRQPLRSQSFKYGPRTRVDGGRSSASGEHRTDERRRSTPNVSRKFSITPRSPRCYDKMRTDVWPEPKTASEIEVRFLQLPDAEDYTRVRQFKIDEKGAVVSRGDSFRRKSSSVNRTGIECTPSPIPHSANGSFSSKVEQQSGTSSDAEADESKKDVSPTTSTTYMIYVIGAPGTGKSTLISQFMTSDHRNPFANEIEDYENTVSVNIGGQESDLIFFEHDLRENDPWPRRDVNLYLLVYCIDSRLSFKKALNVVEKIRECPQTKDLPIVLAGNKIDLERKRAVTKAEAGSAALTYGFVHYEISVALNLEVDDLLVGLIAEIKESMNPRHPPVVTDKRKQSKGSSPSVPELHTDFHDAIRRYSQRKKKQMGVPTEVRSNKCMNFRPWSLIERFRNWRRGSPCLPI